MSSAMLIALEAEIGALPEALANALEAAVYDSEPPPVSVVGERELVDAENMALEQFDQRELKRIGSIAHAEVLTRFARIHTRLGRLCDMPVDKLDREIEELSNRNDELGALLVSEYDRAMALAGSLERAIFEA